MPGSMGRGIRASERTPASQTISNHLKLARHARTLPSEPAPTFPPLTSALHHTSSSQIPGHRGIGYGGGGGARPE